MGRSCRTSNKEMALSIKMSQLGHYETILTLGTCIGNVVHAIFAWFYNYVWV